MEPEQSENPEAATIGLAFARALVNGQFDIAYEMLAPSLRNKCQPEDLKSDYEQMTSYWDAPADHVEVTSVGETSDDWPEKDEKDSGWVFVAIDSNSGSWAWLEAADVRVVDVSGRKLIAEIVWGRP